MKAVVCTEYGPPEVLRLEEVSKPAPRANEVLIRIHATSVTASDCIVRGFKLSRWSPIGFMMGLVIGFSRPRKPILGMVLAGDIDAVGEDVKRFEPGDPVYGSTFRPNQIRFGAYAEYICLAEDSLITAKLSKISYEEAAAIPYGANMALHYLKKGKLQSGQQVLIYGASGAVGTNAVQLAKHHFGAEVTCVCSTANLELVKSMGADQVIDYTQEDFTQNGETYAVVFDAVGKLSSSQRQRALKQTGIYLNVIADSGNGEKLEELQALIEIIEAGKLKTVIDRSYPLEQTAEAHRYVDTGRKKGNVVITVT